MRVSSAVTQSPRLEPNRIVVPLTTGSYTRSYGIRSWLTTSSHAGSSGGYSRTHCGMQLGGQGVRRGRAAIGVVAPHGPIRAGGGCRAGLRGNHRAVARRLGHKPARPRNHAGHEQDTREESRRRGRPRDAMTTRVLSPGGHSSRRCRDGGDGGRRIRRPGHHGQLARGDSTSEPPARMGRSIVAFRNAHVKQTPTSGSLWEVAASPTVPETIRRQSRLPQGQDAHLVLNAATP